MVLMDFLMYVVLLIMSCVIYSSGFVHILQVLMALEFVIISTLMLMIYSVFYTEMMLMGIYYMIFSVCEAIIGLSLMVLMVRYSGNEYMKSLTMSKW